MNGNHRMTASRSTPAAILLTLTLCASASFAFNLQDDTWKTEIGRDHPLVGRIWDVTAERFIDTGTLIARLRLARFVLLGEKHDNPDHHRLQTWVLKELIQKGYRPSVGFEMFSADQSALITQHLARRRGDVKGLAAAVRWAESGWPDWAMYRPIIEAAVKAGLPIVAANLPKAATQAVSREGMGALEENFAARFRLNQPLPPDVQAAMDKEIRAAHCGMANDTTVEAMIRVQRARDATLAGSLAATTGRDGAVLIAGAGHARNDRGVPAALLLRAPGARVLSVAFIEVSVDTDKAQAGPRSYAENFGSPALPFDFVWFTPRVDNLDPCEKFKESLKKIQQKE